MPSPNQIKIIVGITAVLAVIIYFLVKKKPVPASTSSTTSSTPATTAATTSTTTPTTTNPVTPTTTNPVTPPGASPSISSGIADSSTNYLIYPDSSSGQILLSWSQSPNWKFRWYPGTLAGKPVYFIGPWTQTAPTNPTYYNVIAYGRNPSAAGAVVYALQQTGQIVSNNTFNNASLLNGVPATLYIDQSDNGLKAMYADTVLTAFANTYTTLGPGFATLDNTTLLADKVTWTSF